MGSRGGRKIAGAGMETNQLRSGKQRQTGLSVDQVRIAPGQQRPCSLVNGTAQFKRTGKDRVLCGFV